MDLDMGAYVTDEEGTILGVPEIRSRIIAGRLLVPKDVDDTGRLERAWDNWSNFIRGVDSGPSLHSQMSPIVALQEFSRASSPTKRRAE